MKILKIRSYVKVLLISIFSSMLVIACGNPGHSKWTDGTLKGEMIHRMGDTNTRSFDDGWLFKRFGLQADGTSISEPAELQNKNVDDHNWRKLDLPHDWAIEGPFRIELTGETGTLPFKGIGDGTASILLFLPAMPISKFFLISTEPWLMPKSGLTGNMLEPGLIATVHSEWI